MIILTDVDILLKLAALDLIDHLPAAFSVEARDFYVTPVTPHSIKSKSKIRTYGEDAVKRAYNFVRKTKLILEDFPSDRRLMTGKDGIDGGELLLFAATSLYTDALIATGDKRSIKGLYLADGCDHIYERNCGRVICFEKILLRLIKLLGFDTFKDIVIDKLDVDGALNRAFELGEATTETIAIRHLEWYVFRLQSETGDLLADL